MKQQGRPSTGPGKNKNDTAMTLAKGFAVGATMLVPGVSGGSMAMILNIYDRLISAVSSFLKYKRESLLFLGLFCLGACAGMIIVARPLLKLLQLYPQPVMFFFIGAVAGGIPMIYRKARGRGVTWKSFVYPALGFALVMSLAFLPEGLFAADPGDGPAAWALLFTAGLAGAAALVLPGISISYLLLLLGMYDETMYAIGHLYLPYLLPLGAGLLLGTLLCARALEKAMDRYPQPTYLIILGFILGSLVQVFPGFPAGPASWAVCLLTLILGYAAIRAITR